MKVFWRSSHLAQKLCRHQLVNTCLGFDILHLISYCYFFWHCLIFCNSFIFVSICLTNAEKREWKWCICTVWLFTSALMITFLQWIFSDKVLVSICKKISDERYFLVLTLEFKICSIKIVVSFSFHYVIGLIDQGRGKGRDSIYDIKLSSICKYYVTWAISISSLWLLFPFSVMI